ncbi:MATE family efflux transporter [Sulfurihydrogenibium sp.]|uniref:MATE family efflux transporter n=1 Tax=Sulfurihydrogenibium sp. TaxID=2053621 RepID=UPI0026035EAE|nr:MATE family efflux transporter [Sulfurihydrogenibium sp.]
MLNGKTKKILSLAVPAAFSNLFDMIQIIVDMIMLGRVSPVAIAAAGISMQFLGLLYAFMASFSVGNSAVVSRFVGAKQFEEANKTVFTSSVIAFLISIPFTIFGLFFSKYVFIFMGASEEVVQAGTVYLSIISLTFPVIFVEFALYSALNASGDTKTPLKIVIVANIINTVLDYVLIFGKLGFPPLGIKGAAIATATSYYISFVLYLYVFLKKKSKISFYLEFIKDYAKRVLNIGIPAGLERVITYFSFLLFVKMIADYGTYTLAGYQVGLRIEGLAFMPGFGFSIAAMTLVGQSIGANNFKEAEDAGWQTAKIASIFMGLMGVVMVFFPHYLAMIFTDDKKVIEEAVVYLKIVGLTQVPLAIGFVLSGALRGAGATKLTLTINTFSLWFFRLIPAYVMSKIFGNVLYIYYAMFLETFLKAGMLYYVFKKGYWKKVGEWKI